MKIVHSLLRITCQVQLGLMEDPPHYVEGSILNVNPSLRRLL
jgi:hypothetical protein